ncbi:hypothetical protein B0H17DRAFT_1128635 [Mycena rosella]|uniref:Uncharacterized protein n=1 Tax=Mycena rosella TaxID=1033263 RepID=A0AAD7GLV0_MYCRO|nr:hypothetical protein B0H17DRAFT_1128635 [Mycena rosella]
MGAAPEAVAAEDNVVGMQWAQRQEEQARSSHYHCQPACCKPGLGWSNAMRVIQGNQGGRMSGGLATSVHVNSLGLWPREAVSHSNVDFFLWHNRDLVLNEGNPGDEGIGGGGAAWGPSTPALEASNTTQKS